LPLSAHALEPLFSDYLALRARDPEPALFLGVQGRRLTRFDSLERCLSTSADRALVAYAIRREAGTSR
jgi:hypothetical protein